MRAKRFAREARMRSRSAAVGAEFTGSELAGQCRGLCRWPSVNMVGRLGAGAHGRYWLKLAEPGTFGRGAQRS